MSASIGLSGGSEAEGNSSEEFMQMGSYWRGKTMPLAEERGSMSRNTSWRTKAQALSKACPVIGAAAGRRTALRKAASLCAIAVPFCGIGSPSILAYICLFK